ncbi:MAG: iron-sulfur cluster assembly scaffold protein [Peptococcales bacterium]
MMASNWEQLIEMFENELWSSFSKVVIDHAKDPRNLGRIDNASNYAFLTGQCGDTIQIWLKINNDGIIEEITFWTDGCGATIASGSMITELAKGKSIKDALNLTPLDLLKALDGLPDEHIHCAILAVNTLHEAIKN